MKNHIARLNLTVAVAIFFAFAGPVEAALQLRGYNTQRHDRFVNDPAFIGNPYDWSGVSSDGRWATMITPKHFLSAAHHRPPDGAEMTFYHSNDPTGTSETHTVLDGARIAGSDLYLGELETAVSADVAIYSILHPSAALGSEIMVMGLSSTTGIREVNQRMGRNIIDRVEFDFEAATLGVGHTMFYDFDTVTSPTGLGADEARLAGQDSGGPSFTIYDGAPALVGIHWFVYTDDHDNEYGDSRDGSGDTLVSGYIDDLRVALAGSGYDISVAATPEPSSLILLSLFAVGATCQRKRRFTEPD